MWEFSIQMVLKVNSPTVQDFLDVEKLFSVFVSYDIKRFTWKAFKFFHRFKQVVAVVNSVVIFKGFYCPFQLGVLMFSDFID